METRTETVASLLQDGLFDIPHYQRPYAWTEPQLTDLLEDLIYLPEGRTHFFGNIILDPRDDDFRTDRGRRFPLYDVVDGQQRLTTAIILLSIAAEMDDTVAKTVEADSLLHPVGQRPRLLPQDQDKEFFRDRILGDSSIRPETPSQDRLLAAADFYREALAELPAGVSVQDIAGRVRYDCRVNVVELAGRSEAASIFESINDRGRPLSSLDKIKSFLMYMDDRSSNRGALQDRINDRFGKIYTELFVFSNGHERVNDFDEDSVQRFHWGLYNGYDSNEYFNSLSNLKDRLREQYRQGEQTAVQDEIEAYTKGLREAAGAFAELFYPAQRPLPIRRRLTRLFELGRLANVLPVLMAAQVRYGDTQPQKMAAIVERCETFVFRLYAIGRYRSDTGRGKLVSLAHRIASDPSMSHRAIVDRLNGIIRNYADDDRFRRDLSDPEFYKTISSQDIRYLLYHYGKSLDVELGENPNRDLSRILSRDFEVEHILARQLDCEHVPADLTDEFEEHVNGLGNLTIASSSWNKAYGALPFEEKQDARDDAERNEEYRYSGLRVQQALSNYEAFDRSTLEARERAIINFALEEWDTDGSSESVDGSEPSSTSVPFAYQRQVADEDVPSGADIPVDDADHESLVSTLRQAPSIDWVTTSLDLLHDIIGVNDIANDDSRLVASIGQGDRIAISINHRYVETVYLSERPRIGLIANRAIADDKGLVERADRASTFNALPGEEAEKTPYFLRFDRRTNGEMGEDLREAWLKGTAIELDRASGSPYRRYHRPLIYKAAIDHAYRQRLVDEAFGSD